MQACWHDEALETLRPLLDQQQCLREAAWQGAARKGTDAYAAAETVLKGLEIPLPAGETFFDKDGYEGHHIRTRWWGTGAGTYRSVAILDDATRETLSDQPVLPEILPGYVDEKPVFVGHYWLRGTPEPMSDRVACLDYTVTEPAPEGKLTAYRREGEASINADGFVGV